MTTRRVRKSETDDVSIRAGKSRIRPAARGRYAELSIATHTGNSKAAMAGCEADIQAGAKRQRKKSLNLVAPLRTA
jgi:hypothetical protein